MKSRTNCYGLIAVFVSVFIALAVIEVTADVIMPVGSLNNEQIGELVFGNTIVLKKGEKRKREIYFSPQHEIRQIGPGGDYLKGKWKVKNERLCITIRGDKDCRIVTRQENQYRTYIAKKNNKHKLDELFSTVTSGNQISQKIKNKQSDSLVLPPGTLNAEEVLGLFYNKTVDSVTAVKKRKSRSYYARSGQVYQYRDGNKRSGKWRVRHNGRICLQMDDYPEKCRIIVKEDGQYKKYIVKKNGNHVHSVSYPEFTKGNPDNL